MRPMPILALLLCSCCGGSGPTAPSPGQVPPDSSPAPGPDAVACQPAQLLLNGNFDLGPSAEWFETTTTPGELIVADANVDTVPFALRLGGAVDSQDTAEQQVTIAGGPVHLRGRFRTAGSLPDAGDSVRILLTNGTRESVLWQLDASPQVVPWTDLIADSMTPPAGESVALRIQSGNNSSSATEFWFDSLSLTATCN